MKQKNDKFYEKVLVVAAHPDDEVLGCGGTIIKHKQANDKVKIIFLADGISSRKVNTNFKEIELRRKHAISSSKIMGIDDIRFLDFPDNSLDSVQLLKIIKKVEEIVRQYKPTIIYTHHGGDLNIDHRIVHQAVMTACRPITESVCKKILCFEVLSSTEWSNQSIGYNFIPNTFIDISSQLKTKIKALKAYKKEIKKFPHPRSVKSVNSLAYLRGSEVGLEACEAFVNIREIIK